MRDILHVLHGIKCHLDLTMAALVLKSHALAWPAASCKTGRWFWMQKIRQHLHNSVQRGAAKGHVWQQDKPVN